MDVSASMIWRQEDAAEGEKASRWAGRDPEIKILGMASPDVGAEGVCGGRWLGVSLGVAAIGRVGSFGFFSKVYSQNCIWLRMNFLQNMKQKKKKAHSQKSLFLALSCGRSLLSMAALSEVPCNTHQRTARQQENISVQPKSNFLCFSAAWNCLEMVFKPF